MKYKYLICAVIFLICSVCIPCIGAEVPEEYELINLNSGSFPSKNKGYVLSTEHTKHGYTYSLHWNHDTMASRMELYEMPSDWTDYEYIELSMYASGCGEGARMQLLLNCGSSYYSTAITLTDGQNDLRFKLNELTPRDSVADYKAMTHVMLSATGWGMSPTAGAEFWLNSLKLQNSAEILCLHGRESFSAKDAGWEFSSENTADEYDISLYWNHDTMRRGSDNSVCRMEFYSVPSDWTDFSVVELEIFGKSCSGAKMELVINCGDGYYRYTLNFREGRNVFSIPFERFIKSNSSAAWNKVSYIWISASGWSHSPIAGGEFWLKSIKMRNAEDNLEKLYELEDLKKTYAALENAAAVYADSKNVVCGDNVSEYIGTQYVNETVTVPVTLFSDYLGAELDGTVLTANGNTLDISEYPFSQEVYSDNGTYYVPAAEAAKLLGYETVTERKLVIIGDDKIHDLGTGKANVYREIAGYLAYHTDIDPADITEADMTEIKDRWRASLVGGDTEDMTDSIYANVLRQIYSNGNSAFISAKESIAANRTDSLFLSSAPVSSSNMTAEYTQIRYMALAWAQRGQELYHNEELKNTILYCLEWMYENRFGEDEIENNENAWRDHTLTNWYDWQIDTPMKLIDIMMLMEDSLTDTQKENYLGMFQYWVHNRCYESMFSDAGMNVLYTAKNWIGSCLLRNEAEEAALAVSSLHNCFSWADDFRTGEGFYSDGSCVFHYKHAMNGTYGIGQFEKSGMILSVLKNTKLDFKDPRRENIFDWIFDAFEPLIYDGAMFRMVKGRAVNSGDHYVGRQFVIGCLDLVDFADSETLARIKSLVKYIVEKEKEAKIVSYNDRSFTVPQLKKLNDILNDTTVMPREDYYISKVYNNMDKTVHQRKNWAFGISMSSSRIYDYECIHGENTTGWYTSDGMTQLMLADDNYHFQSGYWDSVDPYKYPGTTVDTQERIPHTIDTGSAFVKDFDDVGGVALKNEFSVSAQHLNAFHLDSERVGNAGNIISPHNSTLTARKAWFCFDDEVVCLGSDIDANDGFEVRTIVENRKSPQKVTADAEELVLTGKETDISGKSWVHLENTAGYYFPEGGTLTARKTDADTSFFELWISHGENPENGGYAYTILPTVTAEQTAQYAENPDTYILCNTEEIQAVADKSTGAVGIVFWQAGSFGGITVSEPMAVMLRETGGKTEIAVSDMTHKLSEADITFERPFTDVISADERLKLDESKTVISIDFSGSDGAGIEGDFAFENDGISEKKIAFEEIDGKAYLSADIKNIGAGFKVLSVITAEYSADGKLTDLKIEDVSIPPMSEKSFTYETGVSSDTKKYRGFLWQSMTPLVSAAIQ